MIDICFIIPAIFIILTTFLAIKAVQKGVNKRHAVFAQIGSVLCVMILCFIIPMTSRSVNAEPSGAALSSDSAQAAGEKAFAFGLGLMAAALVTGLSGIGGGIAVASAAPAAIAATSEDPKAFGKSLIFVALGEGIALYGLLVSIMIFNKIDQLGA